MYERLQRLGAAAWGNFMEWFDFTLYGFFAVAIGRNFFPSEDPLLSAMASYAAFAAGFIARPIGAAVLGQLADRVSRKRVLVLTLMLMGLSCLLVLCAPSYGTAGLLGPAMVVSARLLAGFAAAGETGAAATIAIEASPWHQRGLWGGFFSCSTYLGVAAGGVIALLCYGLLGAEVTDDWGWRLGYAAGLLIIPMGWWARRNMRDERHAAAAEAYAAAHARPPGSAHGTTAMIVRVAGLTAFGSSVFYVVIMFMPVFATRMLSLPMSSAMACAMMASVLTGLCAILGGWLSDHHGRKRIMLAGLALSLSGGWLLFLQLLQAPSVPRLAAFQWACASGFGFFVGASLPLMVDSFQPSRRALGFGLGYSLGVMVFGALAPVVNALALSRGLTLAPLYYMSATGAVTLLVLAWTREVTAPPRERRPGFPA